ncbi:hypothetical protein PENTCL1PPCAC_14650, partial [Pristionchus entomophagus]
ALTYIVRYYQHVRKYPKGPFPLPLIGNLYHLNPINLQEYLHKAGKEYGHCFTVFMPRPVVVFTDFTTIKEALITHGEHFAGRSHLPPEVILQKVTQTGIFYFGWRGLEGTTTGFTSNIERARTGQEYNGG